MGEFNRRCIALYSGGLDSLLAVAIMHRLKFEVIPLFVRTPFYKKDEQQLRKSLEPFGLKLEIDYNPQAYMEMLTSPKFGYGKNFNPCIDCKIFFLKRARAYMEQTGATFIVTGDVLGQRPFSQRSYPVLRSIEKRAGCKDIVLRPLSAKVLPETAMEKAGLIKKEDLYGITGRSRKAQFELAKVLGIENYESPAGGCLLTDRTIGYRVKEMVETGYKPVEFELIDVGRHFRINGKLFIVSRNRNETRMIAELYSGKLPIIRCIGAPGAVGLFVDKPRKEELEIAGGIVLFYSKKADKLEYSYGDEKMEFSPARLEAEHVEQLRIKAP